MRTYVCITYRLNFIKHSASYPLWSRPSKAGGRDTFDCCIQRRREFTTKFPPAALGWNGVNEMKSPRQPALNTLRTINRTPNFWYDSTSTRLPRIMVYNGTELRSTTRFRFQTIFLVNVYQFFEETFCIFLDNINIWTHKSYKNVSNIN